MCNSWPFRFAPFFECPADPAVPCETSWNTALWLRSRAEHSETSVFAATFAASLHHVTTFESGRHTTCRCGILSFWFSGEVKHIVHLIRWNLTAVFMPLWLTGTRACCGTIARPFRFRNWVLVSFLCFHQLIPIGPLSHAFFPPQVGRLRRVPRCV